MAIKDQPETPKTTTSTTPAATAPAAGQDRDRGKPRMSEGVRAELELNGYAIDPGTGELIVQDGPEAKPRVVPRDQAVEELRKRSAERAKREESATPRNEPAL